MRKEGKKQKGHGIRVNLFAFVMGGPEVFRVQHRHFQNHPHCHHLLSHYHYDQKNALYSQSHHLQLHNFLYQHHLHL